MNFTCGHRQKLWCAKPFVVQQYTEFGLFWKGRYVSEKGGDGFIEKNVRLLEGKTCIVRWKERREKRVGRKDVSEKGGDGFIEKERGAVSVGRKDVSENGGDGFIENRTAKREGTWSGRRPPVMRSSFFAKSVYREN